MNNNQIQHELSIIKKMIEKTRQETAESGYLFIFIGIFSAIATFVIGMLEIYKLNQFTLPVMIIMLIVNGIIGYIVASKDAKVEKVKTYPKTIFFNLWIVCGITAIMITFLFPFLKVYPFRAVPVLIPLIMGIAVFTTGTIYELRFIQWYSITWWVGACILVLTKSPFRFIIMIAIIVLGWVIPGFILNKQYRNRSKENEL